MKVRNEEPESPDIQHIMSELKVKEIQRGTIRVEQTGSFFDDTFHGQQLIASTPKKHVNEEQLESGQQEQEAEDN